MPALQALAEPEFVATERNCFHCLRDFFDYSVHGQRRLCDACRQPKRAQRPKGEPGAALTLRQRQVTKLAARGWKNKQIARELYLSEGTIKTYLSIIFKKAGATNRTDLAVWWLTKGSLP